MVSTTKPRRVMGVDPSTKTGICTLDADTGAVSSRVIHFPKVDGLHRVQLIARAFEQYLDEQQPDLVTIEGYVRSFHVITLVEIGVHLRMALHIRGLPWYVIPPTVLKKYATGRGDSKKPEIAKAVEQRWGFRSPSDDVTDGYVLARIGVDLLETGITGALKGVVRG